MRIKYKIITFCKKFSRIILPYKIYFMIKKIYLIHFNKFNKLNKFDIEKSKYQFGVNLFCNNTQNSGGSLSKNLLEALVASDIPFNIIDFDNPENFNKMRNSINLYNVNLICLHAAANTKYVLPLFDINYTHHYNIGYWAWELPEVPYEFCQGLEFIDEFWTLSNFCTCALSGRTTSPVLTIPPFPRVKHIDIINYGRKYFNIPEHLFIFCFVFDCMSFTERKNPDAVVESFIKVSSMFKNVGLILKYIYPESAKDYIDKIKSRLKGYKNVFYFENYMTPQELKTLISISGAFISLHRAEGFGLLPLEAMGLGVPVIATEWSGNMEYMNHKNTALVGCRLVPVEGRYVGSTPGDGQVWAEPDVEEAVAYMSRMITDAEWRNSLISHGLETARFFTVERTGRLMRERLEFLGLLNGISQ